MIVISEQREFLGYTDLDLVLPPTEPAACCLLPVEGLLREEVAST